MTNQFLVLQDDAGNFLPNAFISRLTEVGESRAEEYKKKMNQGEKIVVVRMVLADD